MRKFFGGIFLLIFAISYIAGGVVLASQDLNFYNLDDLKTILEQAKYIQKKIVEEEDAAVKYPYKLKVLYPNGGEKLNSGDMLRIRWDASESGASRLDIYLATTTELYSAKNPGLLIAGNVPAGLVFYNWTIPTNYAETSFKILIRNSGKYRLSDYSDGDVSVVSPEKPNSMISFENIVGGENFYAGRTYRINWKMQEGGDRFVNLRLVRADSIATSTFSIPTGFEDIMLAKTGHVDWKIPDIPTGEYRLKIFGINTDCLYCMEPQAKNLTMSETFKIFSSKDIPKDIKVIYPNGDSDIIFNVSRNEKTIVKLTPIATTTNGVATTTYITSTTTEFSYSTSSEKIRWFSPLDIDYVDIFLRSVPSGRLHPIKFSKESLFSATTSRSEYEWTSEVFSKDTNDRFFMRVCRTNTGYCAESERSFMVIASSTVKVPEPTPKPEPTTTEYVALKGIVDKIKEMIYGFGAKSEEGASDVEETELKEEEKEVVSYLPHNFKERISYGLIDSDEVRALQEALAREGLFDHEITGRFFEVTEQAVQEFQTKYELDPSGSVGPGTQAKLNELYGPKENVAERIGEVLNAINETLKNNSVGTSTEEVQEVEDLLQRSELIEQLLD